MHIGLIIMCSPSVGNTSMSMLGMAERGDDDFGSPLLRDDTGPGAVTSRKVFVAGDCQQLPYLYIALYRHHTVPVCVGLSAYQREA